MNYYLFDPLNLLFSEIPLTVRYDWSQYEAPNKSFESLASDKQIHKVQKSDVVNFDETKQRINTKFTRDERGGWQATNSSICDQLTPVMNTNHVHSNPDMNILKVLHNPDINTVTVLHTPDLNSVKVLHNPGMNTTQYNLDIHTSNAQHNLDMNTINVQHNPFVPQVEAVINPLKREHCNTYIWSPEIKPEFKTEFKSEVKPKIKSEVTVQSQLETKPKPKKIKQECCKINPKVGNKFSIPASVFL